MTRDIPGWEPIEASNPAAHQIVDGQWYFPVHGCDALQITLDELVPGWVDDSEVSPDEMPKRIWASRHNEWFRNDHFVGDAEYVRADVVADTSDWVSVEDSLPASDCYCLVWDTMFDRAVPCNYNAQSGMFGMIHPRVSHWRPMPLGPEDTSQTRSATNE